MSMFKQSIVGKTHQTWKLLAGFAGLMIGFLLMTIGLHGARADKNVGLVLAGLSLEVLTTIAACLSVQCPVCGARWLWSALRHQHSSAWLMWLRAQRVCPACGDDPGTPQQTSK
jgi:endogenous inhibitor of DNA gyrase (YacG/DUF329 family)